MNTQASTSWTAKIIVPLSLLALIGASLTLGYVVGVASAIAYHQDT